MEENPWSGKQITVACDVTLCKPLLPLCLCLPFCKRKDLSENADPREWLHNIIG